MSIKDWPFNSPSSQDPLLVSPSFSLPSELWLADLCPASGEPRLLWPALLSSLKRGPGPGTERKGAEEYCLFMKAHADSPSPTRRVTG